MLHIAADGVDAGDALGVLQQWAYDPVLRGTQICGPFSLVSEAVAFRGDITSVRLHAGFTGQMLVVLAVLKLDGPHIDLAQTRGNRTHFRDSSLGEIFRNPG